MAITWSPQQAAFIEWAEHGTGSCVLEAVAGAGKTTTLLEAARRMSGKVAVLAYNKKIAEEIKGKVAGEKNISAGTVHSFGFAAIRKVNKNVKVDGKKLEAFDALIPDELTIYKGAIFQLVSLAKQRALGVVGQIEDMSQWYDMVDHFDVFADEIKNGAASIPAAECIKAAIEILNTSNKVTNVIDFDDMVYLPLIHNMPFWKYDVVMIDEAQDTNAARRALVRAMLKKGGRVVAVGDRHQAIYGFTGADSDSLDLIKKDFNCIELPLTITYRCPKAVVSFAKQWVNHIEAADTAPEGDVISMPMKDLMKVKAGLNGDAAILCRVTKPLVELAFSLLRSGVACKVEGRDIGNGLKKLAQTWKIKTTDQLTRKLREYKEREVQKALAKKNETRAQMIEDQVDTLNVIIDQVNGRGLHDIADVVATIDSMFSDDVKGILTLSTIHKSKGREWKKVFWLNRETTCPSKYARQSWQMEQENNLMYVAATRAQEILIDLA